MKMKINQQGASYRKLSENYYYRRTMLEFNTDYVMSLRLFDSKVIAAQVLDAITGLLSINIDLSYKQQLIRNEIKKMVSMVVKSDDAVISDCFFSFSNDDYNSMLEKAEMNKMGLWVIVFSSCSSHAICGGWNRVRAPQPQAGGRATCCIHN